MAFFTRSVTLENLQKPVQQIVDLANGLAPIFLDAICNSASAFIKANLTTRLDLPYGIKPSPYTDESALKQYGVTRRQLTLCLLKAYFIFGILGYMLGKHLVRKSDFQKLLSRLRSLLMPDAPLDRLENDWKKVLLYQHDKSHQAAFVLGDLLSTMGIEDISFSTDELHRVWSEHLPLMEFACLCLSLQIDRLLMPAHYSQQVALYKEYSGFIKKFDIDLGAIEAQLLPQMGPAAK